ncbi:uncharacterized protein K444DRAFT_434537 [Hyaloscypha bicolor E]|uniref:Uncharacterized protein n=1 Tax=Hyaloscypha bicolor E TaxID=1095630 RepID=A0A2J6T691_9HELO|nr:uncharacterized protein K444DRAFT_434537 [Hyaloscypha bicolor E]PMD58536.1 hypothetical protein K444DRAFT_434537 [Hyaloscypha bicolor E]
MADSGVYRGLDFESYSLFSVILFSELLCEVHVRLSNTWYADQSGPSSLPHLLNSTPLLSHSRTSLTLYKQSNRNSVVQYFSLSLDIDQASSSPCERLGHDTLRILASTQTLSTIPESNSDTEASKASLFPLSSRRQHLHTAYGIICWRGAGVAG